MPPMGFDADGIVAVPGVLAAADVQAMRDCLWQALEVHGVARDAPGTWAAGGSVPLVEVAGALRPGPGAGERLWQVGRAPAFAPLPAALGRAVDRLLGAGVWATVPEEHGGLAMPNFPLGAGPWNVPHAAWHVDEPTTADQPHGWGLLGFALLDAVEPGGGATVAIAGSHRRLGRLATELGIPPRGLLTTDDAIAALTRAEPWFADLLRPGEPAERRRRFLHQGCISAGIRLRVVELTGAAGDLVLMDPRCLHTVSANRSARPRLAMRLTCRRLG
jgi:hypothetical protein